MPRENRGRGRPTGDLSPAKLAKLVAMIGSGKKGEQIAAAIGKSKSYVNNLLRARRRLAPDLWQRLETNEMQADEAFALAKDLDHHKQRSRWISMKQAGPGRGAKPRMARSIREKIEEIGYALEPPERDAVIAALRWVLLESDDILGV